MDRITARAMGRCGAASEFGNARMSRVVIIVLRPDRAYRRRPIAFSQQGSQPRRYALGPGWENSWRFPGF
jgi:hypothetical protein